MIITKLHTRPNSPFKHKQISKSISTLPLYKQHYNHSSRNDFKLSNMVLPIFPQFTTKDNTQLHYSKFIVKGLLPENNKNEKLIARKSSNNRSMKTIGHDHQKIRTLDMKQIVKQKIQQKSISSEVESFFKGIKPFESYKRIQKNLENRPQTAKKAFIAAQSEKSRSIRPNTAIKHNQMKQNLTIKKQKYATDEKDTYFYSQFTSSRLMTKPYNEFPQKQLKFTLIEQQQGIKQANTESEKSEQTVLQIQDFQMIKQKTQNLKKLQKQQLQTVKTKISEHQKYLKSIDKQLYQKYLAWQKQKFNCISDVFYDDLDQTEISVPKINEQKSESYYLEVVKKLEEIQDNIMKANRKIKFDDEIQKQLQSSKNLLSYNQYTIVCKQFNKKKQKRDIQLIENILNKFTNFKILKKQRRLRIFNMCEIIIVPSQTYIINKNDISAYIYFIIKGSVEKQYIKTICSVQKKLVESLFDGDMFGQLENENQNDVQNCNKYNYSIFIKQQTTLIKMPLAQYSLIQSQFLKGQLFLKIQALKHLQCFKNFKDKDLIPLASLLNQRHYGHGEIIVRQGDDIKNFFILTQGIANIIKQDIIVRKKENLNIVDAPYKFCSMNSLKSFHKPEKLKIEKTNIKEGALQIRKNKKNFNIIASDKFKYAYEYQHKFKEIYKGQKILYRAILKGLEQFENQSFQKSKLTIIASSNNCILFELSSQDIKKIPEYILKPLIKQAKEAIDFDEFFTKKENLILKQWDKYKVDLCQQILRSKNIK